MNCGTVTLVWLPVASVTTAVVSTPPITHVGLSHWPQPRKSDFWPAAIPDRKNARLSTFGTGPPKLATKRLSPTLSVLPNGPSASHAPEPAYCWPPALVVNEMMPDCASASSTPSAPVVTDASSTAFVPRLTRCEPLLVARTGAPSM